MASTTTLQQIRRFLADQGYPAEPWSTPAEVLERLQGLLASKHDDDEFWRQLKALVRSLDAERFDPRGLPGFEVLGAGVVDDLIDDLRLSVGPERVAGRSLRQWIGQGAGVGLVAFVLCGLSLSCDKDQEWEPDFTVESWSCEDQADEFDVTDPEDRQRLCSLGDFVKDSGVDLNTKEEMLACIPGLSAAHRASLLEEFETATDDQLYSLLRQMTTDDETCDFDRYDRSGGCDLNFH